MEIDNYLKKIKVADNKDTIRDYEGVIAKTYFDKPKKEKKPRKKFVQKTVPVVASSQSEDFENIAFGSSVLGDLDFGDLNLELSDVEDNASDDMLKIKGVMVFPSQIEKE